MAFIPLGWPQAFKIETPLCVCVCVGWGSRITQDLLNEKSKEKQYEFCKENRGYILYMNPFILKNNGGMFHKLQMIMHTLVLESHNKISYQYNF